MKMKRLSGFSLMEMMIVLLIVAIVAAASAPMINRRMVAEAGDGCNWTVMGANNGIFYNQAGNNRTVAIGTNTQGDGTPRLHIASGGNLHIRLTDTAQDPDVGANISFLNNNTLFTTEAITTSGAGAVADSVVIGNGASVTASNGVAIGSGATSAGGIAIGGSREVTTTTSSTEPDGEPTTTTSVVNAFAPANAINIGFNNEFLASSYGNENNRSDVIALGFDLDVMRDTYAMKNPSFVIGSNITQSKRGISIGADQSTNGDITIGYNITSNTGITIGKDITNEESFGSIIAIGDGIKCKKSKNAVLIGHGATSGDADGNYPVALGAYSEAADNSIALGYGSKASNNNAIAIGVSKYKTGGRGTEYTSASGANSIAIGYNTTASSEDTIAIGRNATVPTEYDYKLTWADLFRASGYTDEQINLMLPAGTSSTSFFEKSGSITNSIAIGMGATSLYENEIILGTPSTTVVIPGNLVVGKTTVLGYTGGEDSLTGIYMKVKNNDSDGFYRVSRGTGNNDLNYDDVPAGMKDLHDKYTGATAAKIYGGASDRRLKNVGEAFKAGLEELKKLELFHYTYKKDAKKTPHVGVMAQDLMKIFPDAVWKGEDGFYRIRMEDMFYALINAVKELDAKIFKHDERIVKLEKENKELHKTIEKLEKRLDALERGK